MLTISRLQDSPHQYNNACNLFLALKQLRKIQKKNNKDSSVRNFLSKQIINVKQLIAELSFCKFHLTLENKDITLAEEFNTFPSTTDYRDLRKLFRSEVGRIRAERRELNSDRKVYMGWRYHTVGGVFSSKSEILSLKKTPQIDRLQEEKAPRSVSKTNYLGFEFEFYCALDFAHLSIVLAREGLGGFCNLKRDGSLRAPEGYYCHEITVLVRQEGFSSIINKLMEVLRSDEVRASVNSSCGFHLHLDMRNRNPYRAYNNLVKSLPLLSNMIPNERRSVEAGYCKLNQTSDLSEYYPDPKSFTTPRRSERYQAINPVSLAKFNTLEVRLHYGTLSYEAIIQWTRLCLLIADRPVFLDEVVTPYNYYDMQFGREINDFINRRLQFFQTPENTTVTAHLAAV